MLVPLESTKRLKLAQFYPDKKFKKGIILFSILRGTTFSDIFDTSRNERVGHGQGAELGKVLFGSMTLLLGKSRFQACKVNLLWTVNNDKLENQ